MTQQRQNIMKIILEFFFDDLENKLNQELDITNQGVINNNKEFGTQFRVSENSNNRVQIESLQSFYNARQGELVANIPTVTLQAGGTGPALETTAAGVWSKPDGEAGIADNRYMDYINTPLGRGASLFRSKVYRLDPAGTGNPLTEGFIVGLTTTNPSSYLTNTTFMSNAQLSYGVHVADKTANYSTIKDGTFTATATAAEIQAVANRVNSDVIDWVVANGKIECRLFQNSTGAVPTILFTEAYDYVNKPKLYPFMVIRGGRNDAATQNVRLFSFKFCLDPYLEKPPSSVDIHETLGAPAPPSRRVNNSASNMFFDLGSPDVANYLSFRNQRIPTSGTSLLNNLVAIADQTFNALDQTSNYLIILDSLNIDSYDDFSDDDSGGQRRSILATIPNNGSSVAYEPNNINYIDINNVSDLSLRNFYSRVVRSDYGKLRSVGLLSMTILIKEKNEMV